MKEKPEMPRPTIQNDIELNKENIIFLHGLGRTHYSFMVMKWAMRRAGYRVTSIHYPSLMYSIDECANHVAQSLHKQDIWNQNSIVHFVTHSMGGLVLDSYLRRYVEDIPTDKLGRVVMLAPPWGGSEIADFWSRIKLYHWIYGPAGRELTTTYRDVYTVPVPYTLGVITGTRPWFYPDAWFLFNDPNDGRVRIHRTHVPGMADHIAYPVGHSSILNNKTTHQQTLHFLQTGRFYHDAK